MTEKGDDGETLGACVRVRRTFLIAVGRRLVSNLNSLTTIFVTVNVLCSHNH